MRAWDAIGDIVIVIDIVPVLVPRVAAIIVLGAGVQEAPFATMTFHQVMVTEEREGDDPPHLRTARVLSGHDARRQRCGQERSPDETHCPAAMTLCRLFLGYHAYL